MGGGLMQLVAYGAQDIYLTGNPQITFFKLVYRRHTNFSKEAIEQTWDGVSSDTGRCSATISRNGDLVYRMYIETKGTLDPGDVNNPGAWLIKTIELEIGGQQIDKHSGAWMEIWAELTEPNDSGAIYDGKDDHNGTLFQKMAGMAGACGDGNWAAGGKLFIPLQFWFCRNPGLALPLIALQYHEVKVILDHRVSDLGGSCDHSLWCDYIYLDTDERRRFAQVSHEYLIEQVQEQSLNNPTGTSDLYFNHPVKELVWAKTSYASGASRDTIASAGTYQLKLNGHDRFAARHYYYFTRTQIWEHHSGPGGLDSDTGPGNADTGNHFGMHDNSIAVYSFALKPEEHQPSGTCNFSRIDNAQLLCASGGLADTIFAVNYNVLRIMSGMGGLAYSN
jgi:hypothetical protein